LSEVLRRLLRQAGTSSNTGSFSAGWVRIMCATTTSAARAQVRHFRSEGAGASASALALRPLRERLALRGRSGHVAAQCQHEAAPHLSLPGAMGCCSHCRLRSQEDFTLQRQIFDFLFL
jgi:hypothetical protein